MRALLPKMASCGSRLFFPGRRPLVLLPESRRGQVRVGPTFRKASTWQTQSPYDLLGVSQTASTAEIKVAYFKAAKKAHPDLNPTDPEAKGKFQRVSAAYDLLKDPERRRAYDSSSRGWTSYGRNTGAGRQGQRDWQQQQYSNNTSYQAADDAFKAAMRDVVVIKEALLNYIEDVTEELSYGVECFGRGEFAKAFQVVRENSGLFVGFALPLIFLRSPALVTMVLTVGGRFALQILILTNQLPTAAEWLWRRAVAIAAERVKRRAERRGR